MRVTYIINNLFIGDGVGNSIVELSRYLISRGAELRILYENRVEPPDDLKDLLTAVTYEHLRDREGPADVQEAIDHWLSSELVLYDYPIYYPLVQAVALAGQGTRIFIYHGVTPPHLWPHALGRRSVQRGVDNLGLVRHADHAVAASDFAAQELVARGYDRQRVEVLPYAVHSERFYPRPSDDAIRHLWGLHGNFVLLYTGRMASNKGIDTLVRGLAAARKSGLPIKLLLLGEKASEFYMPVVKQAEAVAEKMGVRAHVIFTGRVSDEVLPRYFSVADLYVSGSLHEGFGIPLVEAMACGKPVVAARAASVPAVVGEGGRFFPPGDAAALSQAVVELLGSVAVPPVVPPTPPRLCFVVPRYGPGFAGGAETLCRAWAENCRRAGWTVQVVATTTDCMIDWNNHFSAGAEVLNGVPVRRFAVERRTMKEHFHFHHLLNRRVQLSIEEERRWQELGIGRPALCRWLAEHRDDFDFFVFLPYLFNTTILGIEAVRDKAIVIPCLHDEGPAYTTIVRQALESAQAVFFNSPGERDFAMRALRLNQPNCFTLGMGMETHARGNPALFREKYGVRGDYLVYCGRLEEGKNVPLLLDYHARYRAARSRPIALVLLGTGTVPAADGVHALGFLPEADKRDALAGAVALVNPSVNESFSIVLMESWLQDRPVLVHGQCAVTRDHVGRSGGGLWFEDAGEFAAALDTLVDKRALADRLGAQGRRYVEHQYSWPVLLDRFRERLDLLRTASAYEKLALKALARARYFDHDRYVERWDTFLAKVRVDSGLGPQPCEREIVTR